MKKLALATVLLATLLIGGQALAMHHSIVGGFRGGAAFGMGSEYHFTQSIALRFGVEGTTGNNPLILSLGGHFFNIQPTPGILTPWFVGLGVVSYSGNNSTAGGSASIIYDPLERTNPFFAEAGIDLVGSPRIMAQVGYYIVSDAQWQ